MSDTNQLRIISSETLSNGIMVHFEGGDSVFFSAQFLYDKRDAPSNKVFKDGIAVED